MEVEFRKDLKHNYMIIATEEPMKMESYSIRLLQKQSLAGILPYRQSQLDDKCLHYYEITGKQSIPNLLERSSLSYDRLREFMEHILETLELAYDYLLTEEDFILIPEQIFLDVVTGTPYLCYLSGYHKDSKEQMNSLLEYLLNKVDYSDKEAVLLVYRLYAVSKEEGFTFSHLQEVLSKKPEEVPKSTQRLGADSNKTRKPEVSGHTDETDQASEEVMPSEILRENQESRSLLSGMKRKVFSPEKTSLLDQIPVVLEEQKEEKEVCTYPISVYLFTGIGVIIGFLILVLCFTTGILYNTYADRLEYSRLIGIVLIILCSEAYVMRKIWSRDNQIAKIVTKSEYIDPRPDSSYLTKREINLWQGRLQEGEDLPSDRPEREAPVMQEREQEYSKEDSNPTCILSDCDTTAKSSPQVLLQSLEEESYPSIAVKEFPFFIGKLRKNVDYYIDKSVVSRYHAKLTKEKDNFYITDLNSTNGTYVNEAILRTYEKQEIKPGDKITLANLRFEFLLN